MITKALNRIKWLAKGRASVVSGIWNHPLNRGSRVKAIIDYIVWNCARFSMDCSHVVRICDDLEIILRKQENYGSAVYTHGLSDYSELLFLAHLARASDVFIDIGGNVGMYSIWVSKITGARSVVFEPVPSTFALLEKNIRLNNLSEKIIAKRLAIGNESGFALMTTNLGGRDHIVSDGETCHLVKVPVASLDQLVTDLDPVAIKIDVEGFELLVLKGARDILCKPSLCAIIIEMQNWTLHNFGSDEADIRNLLESIGFFSYGYDPTSRELFCNNKKHSLNEIFVRHTPELMERLKTAAPVKTLLMSQAV
jgi:FkbM family methyltransferase